MLLISSATSASLASFGMTVGPVPAAAAGAPPASLTATAYPPMGSVVIQNPLPNFTAAAPGPTNGALTAAELGALSSDPQKAESQFNVLAKEAGFGAYLRLWTDANGPGKGANDIVVTLYRIANSQDAASFASGSQQPYQQPGAASSFSVPSIPGAHGYTVSISSPSQVTEQVVLFKSDPYVAIVQLASSVATTNPAPLNPSDAITVSFQQYTAMRRSLGAQTPGVQSGTASATAKSGNALPMVLAIIGGLVVVAVAGWIAAGPPRDRRRRRRAAFFAASQETGPALPIDVPLAETRPVRLARGPVIRVVEVEPRTGAVVSQPKAVPARAAPRPVPAARPVPQPELRAKPNPAVRRQPEPSWSAALPATEPEPPVPPAVETGSGFETTIGFGPGGGGRPGAVPGFEPEPVLETEPAPSLEPLAAHHPPDLEELELAESAAARLAALELAELGTLMEPVSLGEPEVSDRFAEPRLAPAFDQMRPAHWPAPTPGPASAGSGQTPVGRFDDPPTGTPPGWLPDPSGLPDVLRYWDGHSWTFHVATRSAKP